MYENSQPESTKYKILGTINDLSIIERFLGIYNTAILYNNLEIEPYKEFSTAFQADYWYIKYYLLKDGNLDLSEFELSAFYREKYLNIIWLSVKVKDNSIIECKDGVWFITILTQDKNNEALLDDYNLYKIC